MKKYWNLYFTKAQKAVRSKKIIREILEEFFNHGIGYLAGLMAYNYLSRYIEVKGIKNLWGLVKNKKKILVNKDTFENIEFIISAIVGFIIFKIATYYSRKLWEKYEQSRNGNNTHDSNIENKKDKQLETH